MIVFESERVSRLVGRLERGQAVPGAFERLARDRDVAAGWIRGLGAFEWVELSEYDQKTQKYRPARRFDTPCEILTLEGNLSMKDGQPFAHLHATVSRETEAGVEVLGGHLVAAQVFACEFSIECYDDVCLERTRDDATGLSLWRAGEEGSGEESSEEEAAGEGAGVTWAQVAAVSSAPAPPPAETATPRRKRSRRTPSGDLPPAPRPGPLPDRQRTSEEAFLQERHPERGEYIEHRQFGVCRVEGEDAEGGLRIRLPTGVRKVIRLDYLQVFPPREEDGRRVYPVRPRRGR
ncbi:MAG: PPC domain-containing DNA-binding protein [Myxococcota bacterium]